MCLNSTIEDAPDEEQYDRYADPDNEWAFPLYPGDEEK